MGMIIPDVQIQFCCFSSFFLHFLLIQAKIKKKTK
jgi:hypothetical protein